MEFKSYSFKDLLENIVDNRGKTCPVENDGMPLIATNCIKDNSLYAEYERVRYVSDDTYQTWFRGHPEPEDIIFVCKGSPGRVAWVQNPVPYCIAQDMVAIRAKKDVINSKFLFALLRNPKTQKSILNMHVGTMIPHFKKGDFSNLYFDIPTDLVYQKWAGELYFTFCEKIEANKQINNTLEQMAQALFKSWFVDFDPVIDNALDAGTNVGDFPEALRQKVEQRKQARELSGFKPLPDDVRILFPSEFVQTNEANTGNVGWIPKGWMSEAVSKVIQVNPKTTLPKGATAKFADMKAIPTSGYMIDEIINKEFKGGTKFVEKDVLFARITPCLQNGKTALVDFLAADEVGFGSTEFIIFRQNEKVDYSFIACLAREDNFRAHCMQSMVGSSGRQRVQNACFDDYYLALPSQLELLEQFSRLISPTFTKMTNNKLESQSLIKLRDTLLPKLISGELQLPDTEQEVENKKALA